jgi:protein gp37
MNYTVKVEGPGTLAFRGKQARLPATFNRVTAKDLKILKVMCQSINVNYEILEKESERLAAVAKKAQSVDNVIDVSEIEETETKIEDLFDSDDSLGDILKNLEKD